MNTYYHVTIEARVPGILKRGLLVKYSAGHPRNWFVLPEDLDWAASHVYDFYGARPTYWLVTWHTDQQLYHLSIRGYETLMLYTLMDVPPDQLEFIRLGEYICGRGNKSPFVDFTRWAETPPPDLYTLLAEHQLGQPIHQNLLHERALASP